VLAGELQARSSMSAPVYVHPCTSFADIVVDDNKIILELKSVNAFSPAMEAQLLNYLSISKLKVGYLINFHGSFLKWKRMVL